MRTSKEITQAEVDAYKRGFARHNIVWDENEASASWQFGEKLGKYIIVTCDEDLTDQAFDIALQRFKEAGHQIPYKSQAQVRWEKQAAQHPQQADALISFLQQQRILLNTDDALFVNATALLPQLVGREITFKTFQEAIGRTQYKGSELHFVPGPEADRSVVNGRVNHAAKSNESFMPKSEVRSTLDQSYESNPLRHKADPQQPKPEPVLDSTEARWKSMAENLLGTGNSHGEKHELRQAFDNRNGRSWRRVFEEMTEIKRNRQRRATAGW